jgi:hypothetical protein
VFHKSNKKQRKVILKVNEDDANKVERKDNGWKMFSGVMDSPLA